MKNYNTIKCSNCGEDNLLFEKNCIKCKHYLRPAVVNIDLWKTIWMLFENPKKSVMNIIMAEHKNFFVFLLLFLSFKLFLTSATLQSAFGIYSNGISGSTSLNIILLTSIYSVIILLFSLAIKKLFSRGVKTRFKDNLSILVYSFIPIIFSLFILTPVEYGIFGKHWIVYNPSPFLIKSTFAYLFTGLEILMMLWSLVILFIGLKIQTNSIITALISLIAFIILITGAIIFIPSILL